jgi:hypothetical protein
LKVKTTEQWTVQAGSSSVVRQQQDQALRLLADQEWSSPAVPEVKAVPYGRGRQRFFPVREKVLPLRAKVMDELWVCILVCLVARCMYLTPLAELSVALFHRSPKFPTS